MLPAVFEGHMRAQEFPVGFNVILTTGLSTKVIGKDKLVLDISPELYQFATDVLLNEIETSNVLQHSYVPSDHFL